MKHITRRDFLRVLGAGTIGLMTNPRFPFASVTRRSSMVVQCHDDNATSGSSVNKTVVQIMVDESVKALTNIDDIGEAWKSVFPGIAATSIIGIKVNAANENVSTRPESVDCIINGLTQMQFAGNSYIRNNIIIYDRDSNELSDAGYTVYTGSDPNIVRCFGSSQAGVGYDMDCPLSVDVYPSGTYTKYPSKILSLLVDYLINFAVIKDHDTAGVTLTLKNHYGSVNLPVGNPLHYAYCNPSIPSLSQQIRDVVDPPAKQKIFILDALIGCYSGGPNGPPNFYPNMVLMSLDPVAIDTQGQNLINAERALHGLSHYDAPHITTAAQSPYDLGTTDIDLVEIENPSRIDDSPARTPATVTMRVTPDPFRTSTNISFGLTRDAHVHIDIIDRTGTVMGSIYAGSLSAGKHRIPYRPHGTLPHGTYFIRLYDGRTMYVQKCTRIK